MSCKVSLEECEASGCDGWAVVSFDIGADGRPVDSRVTLACPERFFDEAALRAVRQWQYDPKDAGRRDVRVRMEFDQ